MEARSIGSVTWPDQAMSREQLLLVRLVLLVSAGFLLALSGIFLVRRLVGAFEQPLAPGTLIVLAAVMTMLVAVVRGAWRRVSGSDTVPARGSELLLDVILSLGVICLAASLSLPGSATVPLVVFWCLLVLGEFVGWSPYYRRLARRSRAGNGGNGPQTEESPSAIDEPAHEHSAVALHRTATFEEATEDDGFELLSSSVLQRITRAREENGVEVAYGVARCDFAVGQRQQNLHIAFCPPLERIPELTTDQIDGPIVRIKQSMVETFGAGLEIKLPAPSSEPTSVQVQFYACEKPDDCHVAT